MPSLARIAGQLLDEEGVAFGAGDDGADLLVGERRGVQGVDQVADRGFVEGTDVQPVQAGQPGPLGEGGAQGVAAVHVVAAVGDGRGTPGR